MAMRRAIFSVLFLFIFMGLWGCGSDPVPRTGFISDYSSLKVVDSQKDRYVSPKLSQYQAYIVDQVQLRTKNTPEAFSPSERAEVAKYMWMKFVAVLRAEGYKVTTQAGVGVARVRFAITDIQEATWWMNLHPASKLTGAATGGASMEGEVIDSVTGEQLAAVVKTGRGNQFELDTFDKLDDVKDVIDVWAEEAKARLNELRQMSR